jgi:hypothetical protein
MLQGFGDAVLRAEALEEELVKSRCWGDLESSLSYTKNKRVSLAAQVSKRKAQRRNPRSHWFLFHLSKFVFRPVPFVASRAAKRAQNNPGR